MGRIAVLPTEVAGRIAAGEVIERPASVVKELIENALDAGARRIEVALAEGGTARIAVTDDGCGMDAQDAVLAFSRHATSKLRAFEDLSRLATLGFRGEALPSIGAVGRVELVTAVREGAGGTRVTLVGGGGAQADVAPAAPGTRVEVADLFFNMPARRASLRGVTQELTACVEAATAAALARPDVAFRLLHNDREVLVTPGDGELLSAVVALWGPEVGRAMLPVTGRDGGWEVRGLCGTPARARGNRGLQFISVDGRPVRADAVRGAIEGTYRGLLMVHRYPVFILHLSASPGSYDPNVHPSKREVRFLRVEPVRDLCHRAVRAALRRAELIPEVALAVPDLPHQAPRPALLRFGLAAQAAETATDYTDGAAPPGVEGAVEVAARLPPLRPLGQVADAYIVAEGPDGLYLIDQHAAHERVFFEEFSDRAPGPGQLLLEPVPVDLTAEQWRQWEHGHAHLAAVGLLAEGFGGTTILVRAVPAGLGPDPAAAVQGLLAEVGGPVDDPLTARLALAACKAAIKAGQPLGLQDMVELLHRLSGCREPHRCPHGRPTLLHLGLGTLERHFGRR